MAAAAAATPWSRAPPRRRKANGPGDGRRQARRPKRHGGEAETRGAAGGAKAFRAEAMARFNAQLKAQRALSKTRRLLVQSLRGVRGQGTVSARDRRSLRTRGDPPHVLGKFSQLLIAAESHPAMIFYLDNQRSSGPGSKAGRFDSKGLNENLAREILELHTLGVDGGYTQADVTSLARIITGWSSRKLEANWRARLLPVQDQLA